MIEALIIAVLLGVVYFIGEADGKKQVYAEWEAEEADRLDKDLPA